MPSRRRRLNHRPWRNPAQLDARHLARRISSKEIKLFSEDYFFLKPGELLGDKIHGEFYPRMWAMARADSFEAAPAEPDAQPAAPAKPQAMA